MECQAEEKSREESQARDLHDLHVGPDCIDNQDGDDDLKLKKGNPHG